MQVRYLALAQCRRLRIQCCHNCGLSRDCGLDQIPSRGAPYVTGWPKIKGEKKKRLGKGGEAWEVGGEPEARNAGKEVFPGRGYGQQQQVTLRKKPSGPSLDNVP